MDALTLFAEQAEHLDLRTPGGAEPVRGPAFELGGGGTVACDTVFVAATPRPHDSVLAALGCARDPGTGLVAVDPSGATDVPGVWAAGNVVNPRAQVVTAAGAASVAAIALTGWLLDRDLTRAVEGDHS